MSKRQRACRTLLLRQTISPTEDGEPGGEFFTSSQALTILALTVSSALQRRRRSVVHLLHLMGYVHAF